MWTQFWDMHSGGRQKLKWAKVFIELPEHLALAHFEEEFGRDPYNITCSCCGEDYSVSEYATLEEATGYERGCEWDNETNTYTKDSGTPLSEYLKDEQVLLICIEDILGA